MGLTYQSTRGGETGVSASMAILQGLAKDGGLFMPTEIPKLYDLSIRSVIGDRPPGKGRGSIFPGTVPWVHHCF